MRSAITVLLVLSFATVPNLLAQDAPSTPAETPGAAAPQQGGGNARTPQGPRPYDQVITAQARTDEGVFAVHHAGDRIYYEIPTEELGKDFLWVSQIARTTLGAGYGGQSAGNRVVRWERVNNRVLLRNVSYAVVADKSQPIAKAVEAANTNAIIMSFNVEAVGQDDAPVIEVNRLFTSDVPEFSARTQLRARNLDANRSFIEYAASYPENIEVEATQTYTNPPDTQPAQGAPGAPSARVGAATVVMHYSMVKLPENPMMPRLFDDRVGYFNIDLIDFGQDEHRAPRRSYIERWRLEKKDPNAEISEPVKPLVYWLDPATPTKWIPYLKQGIESWQPAFEMAGFKNAIIAKEAPSRDEDPEFSAEDARYSVVRWLPSTTENAFGPWISVEQETLDGAIAYRPTDFLTDLRRGIWSELTATQIKIDAFRRNTQRLYVQILADKLDPRVTDDTRAFARGELRSLNAAIGSALPQVTDRPTRLHMEDVQDRIAKALDPKFVAAPAPAAGPARALESELNCFPDYGIY